VFYPLHVGLEIRRPGPAGGGRRGGANRSRLPVYGQGAHGQ